MKNLIEKYSNKLVAQGVCDANEPLLGGLDSEIIWNKSSNNIKELQIVTQELNINSILFSKPAEPYLSIINFLTENLLTTDNAIFPEDCETRTFLHDIPVIAEFNSQQIVTALKKRKAVIINGKGIVTFGIVSPEQAFITYCSVCFACFVKFFTDYYYNLQAGIENYHQKAIIIKSIQIYNEFLTNYINPIPLSKRPFLNKEDVIKGIIHAGKLVVDYRLVDSFFGNISFRLDNTIFISQTTSSLDELAGNIDPCPMDNSSCVAITASSELSAHKDIYIKSNKKAILHGHPKFSVIMSMLCHINNCHLKGSCHLKCPEKRFIGDIPIVPGEVGTGTYGLSKTLPPAILNNRGAIVYGHGVFTVGQQDYTDAFYNLLDIEKMCMNEYLAAIKIV